MDRYNCPRCDRTVFNRRLADCEFCGERLPAELLLSDEQLAEADLRDLSDYEVERVEREQERERQLEQQRRGWSSFFWWLPF